MAKIGRNDPCPCGSGKKYKKCCLGKTDAIMSHSEDEVLDDDLWDDIDETISQEEEALYKDIDEVIRLHEKDKKSEEAGRKLLEVTANLQETPDDFFWDIAELAFEIANEIRRDKPELAIELLERSVVLDSENASYWQRDIAEILIEKGSVEDGFAMLHKLAEEDPDDIWCWIALGRNYVDVKDYAKAEEYLNKAIEVGEDQGDDDISTAYIHLFDVYRAKDMIDEAIEAWEISIYYDDFYRGYVRNVCDMLIEKNDLETAKSFANRIEDSVEQHYYMGKIDMLQGNETEAHRHWNSVLREFKDHDYEAWAEVALRLGKHKLVIQKLPSFLRRYPYNISCRILLSIAYAIEMDMGSARKVLMEAPRGIEISDSDRSLYEGILTDESIRSQWLSIFNEFL